MAWRERETDNPDDRWWEQPDSPYTQPQQPQQPAAQQLGAVQGTPSGSPPQTREAEPWWWDYNGGSPPSVPLGGGMNSWDWDGTRWWQTPGTAKDPAPPPPPGPPPPTHGGPPPPTGGGGVPSIPAANINVPGSSLPSGVTDLFNKQPTQTPIQSAYQDALLKYMAQSQTTPSLDDPILQPQAEVYRASAQRGQERHRKIAAERAAATGQSQSGYLDNMINKGVQDQNMSVQAFNASLLGGELNKRREELQAALQLAASTGNAEATRELQGRLAQVSAMMQQQGLNLQGELGRGDLALRLMQTQMGNDQFYDQLGVNTSLNMENMNQRALQTILGGL